MSLFENTQTIYIELLGNVNLFLGLGIQVLASMVLGGIVGYDREKKMKAAGLKTNILICMGACMYTSMSLVSIAQNSIGAPDPNRVSAQIVSGIGFLGAGAIIQGRGNVIGLTTAATIWVVAAIGYTVGVGHPFSATIFSLTVLIVLKMINPLYRFLEREKDQKPFQLEVLSYGSITKTVKDIIFSETLDIIEIYEEDIHSKKNYRFLTVVLMAHPRMMERICAEIKTSVKVDKVNYHPHLEDIVQDHDINIKNNKMSS
jgi:putative Mg2+ transporter-C (MgtC) family protein